MEMIADIHTSKDKHCHVKLEVDDGLLITTHYEQQECAICWLMEEEGEPPKLIVYADPESEEPTHTIDLSAVLGD